MAKIAGTKMLKLVQDPCFGEKYETAPQCPTCWIKKSCHVKFRNSRPKPGRAK